jgi:predicted aconitase
MLLVDWHRKARKLRLGLVFIISMKIGKDVGQSGIRPEMLRAAGVSWVTDLCNLVAREGTIPADWRAGL